MEARLLVQMGKEAKGASACAGVLLKPCRRWSGLRVCRLLSSPAIHEQMCASRGSGGKTVRITKPGCGAEPVRTKALQVRGAALPRLPPLPLAPAVGPVVSPALPRFAEQSSGGSQHLDYPRVSCILPCVTKTFIDLFLNI